MDDIRKDLFHSFEDEVKDNHTKDVAKKEPMKIFLRIRPFLPKEITNKEDQDCIVVKANTKVELHAPKDSFTFKSGARGLVDQIQEFTFSHVFDEKINQKDFFDATVLPLVKDILDGQNGLCFTYGVTNSGKTYTIQGTPKDGGILPRALDVVFNSIAKKLYKRPNLKPKHCHDVVRLAMEEEAREEVIRTAIIHAGEKENVNASLLKFLNSTTKSDATVISENTLSDISVIQKAGAVIDSSDIAEELRLRVADSTTINVEPQGNVKFAIWVSFMEIYNEQIFDLLDLTPIGKGKRRAVLKMGDDKDKNPYVKGLTEVFVTSSDEAYKVLRLGQKNRHIASTKLNQLSSRSHSIFSIKLLKIMDVDKPHVARISRLSVVDLAGSERYCKTGSEGDRLKEASNINCSIMTLGKCISTLRYNQEHPNNPIIVPFRESKLTRLFQSFFRGKGKATMVVNVSKCASVFDETNNVMKFSAVAKEIKMRAQRATELWKAPPLSKVPETPSVTRPPLCIVTPANATTKKRTLNDPSSFTHEELVNIVNELRDKVRRERVEKAELEKNIRKEVSEELNELMVEIENSHHEQLREQKQLLEDTMEKRIDLLTKVANKAKKRRRNESGDDESANILLQNERLKVKDLEDTILTLQAQIRQLKSEQNFFKQSRSPDDKNKIIQSIKSQLSEAKEALHIQNEDMERMQMNLQEKDDEIDKLREALDEFDGDEEKVKIVGDLETLLERTTKELDIARVKLDNRDKRIRELETICESQRAEIQEVKKSSTNQQEFKEIAQEKNKHLKAEKAVLENALEEANEKLNELSKKYEDLAQQNKLSKKRESLLQFENEEYTTKLERLEKTVKELQEALKDSEEIIDELNQQVNQVKSNKKFFDDEKVINQFNEDVMNETKDNEQRIKEDLQIAENKIDEYSQKIMRLESQLKCYHQHKEPSVSKPQVIENTSEEQLKSGMKILKKALETKDKAIAKTANEYISQDEHIRELERLRSLNFQLQENLMKKDKEVVEFGKSFGINEQTTVTEAEEESALEVDADESAAGVPLKRSKRLHSSASVIESTRESKTPVKKSVTVNRKRSTKSTKKDKALLPKKMKYFDETAEESVLESTIEHSIDGSKTSSFVRRNLRSRSKK